MKTDIILAGVGGQGILSIATVIGEAALHEGLLMKQSEVHGMSQRGGDVQSHLRISDQTIYSDLIPMGKADLILALEPMEALRYLPYLSPNGWLVTNINPIKNIPDYPELEQIHVALNRIDRKVVLHVDEIAQEMASIRSANMVLLGAATPFLKMHYENIQDGIRRIFQRKGDEIVNMNLSALEMGRKVSNTSIQGI